MKRFDREFRQELRKAVEEIEAVSGAEVVATILPRVFRYFLTDFIIASTLAFLVLTVMFFVETEFHYVLIYFETLSTFVFVFVILWIFPGLKRLFIGKTRLRVIADMKARAIFQEAGIHRTRLHTGVLFVFCFFERQAILLPDSGAEEMVPPEEWNKLKVRCQTVFIDRHTPEAILGILRDCREIFQTYIPKGDDKFNELPDELWLH